MSRPANMYGKRSTRGFLYVEYIILTLFAGITVALGMATFGPKLVDTYSKRRAVLYAPTP